MVPVTCKQPIHTGENAEPRRECAGTTAATCSFDGTWRLWDVETGACLTEQEGHSRAVYSVAFHPDGSLCASGGLDAHSRVWDCRTGRNIMTFQGHVKAVLALDFSANGYHVASGAALLLLLLLARASCSVLSSA